MFGPPVRTGEQAPRRLRTNRSRARSSPARAARLHAEIRPVANSCFHAPLQRGSRAQAVKSSRALGRNDIARRAPLFTRACLMAGLVLGWSSYRLGTRRRGSGILSKIR